MAPAGSWPIGRGPSSVSGAITLTVLAALEVLSALVLVPQALSGPLFAGAASPLLDAALQVLTGVLALVFLGRAYRPSASAFLSRSRRTPTT